MTNQTASRSVGPTVQQSLLMTTSTPLVIDLNMLFAFDRNILFEAKGPDYIRKGANVR
jgi:hypothetical protein